MFSAFHLIFNDSPELASLAAVALVIEVIGILSPLEAIFKTRTAQGSIAWAISLIALPMIMVPLYWIFGRRKFRGYQRADRLNDRGIQRLSTQLSKHLSKLHNSGGDELLRPLTALTQMPETSDNRLQLLIDGEAYYQALFELIESAQHYVLLEFYIVRDDEIGRRFQELLIAKRQQGVEIYFIYDEIGSLQLGKRYLRQLLAAGVNVTPFNTTKGWRNRFQLNFRNHRKIAIADGDRGLLGGSNVGDEYAALSGPLAPWRDTNILVEGPAVQCMQLAFLEDWHWATESVPTLNWEPMPTQSQQECLILPTGPADSLESCALYILHLINSAQQRLWIVSPYFVPDPAVISALQLAALRGVDVRILLPEKTDNRLVQLSSYAIYKEMLSNGIQLFRYHSGFLHQKVILVDDGYASIGTANLDNRSFRLNFEISLLSRSRPLLDEVEQMLERDFANSSRITLNDYRQQSIQFRLLVRCAYLLAPIQ